MVTAGMNRDTGGSPLDADAQVRAAMWLVRLYHDETPGFASPPHGGFALSLGSPIYRQRPRGPLAPSANFRADVRLLTISLEPAAARGEPRQLVGQRSCV